MERNRLRREFIGDVEDLIHLLGNTLRRGNEEDVCRVFVETASSLVELAARINPVPRSDLDLLAGVLSEIEPWVQGQSVPVVSIDRRESGRG